MHISWNVHEKNRETTKAVENKLMDSSRSELWEQSEPFSIPVHVVGLSGVWKTLAAFIHFLLCVCG